MGEHALTDTELQALWGCALRAALQGGGVIRDGARRRSGLVIEHKRLNDLVSEVDRDAERAIVGEILRHHPTHVIVAEEGTCNPRGGDERYRWIIDPLDGTTNFLHGIEHYAVSIAAQYLGQTVVAVVYNPVHHQCYEARIGQGARLNGMPLRVAQRSGLSEALVGTGLPYPGAPDAGLYFKLLDQVWRRCRNVRRAGAAALDLANVAAGCLDGFFEFDLLPWDIAAGALLVTEAGGCVSDLHGADSFLQHGYIAAGSPAVHRDLLAAVRVAGAVAPWYRTGAPIKATIDA